MAKIITEVVVVKNVYPHPNADKLDIVPIKGWQCIVAKNAYSVGDKVVYFQPDSLIPIDPWATKFGVVKYLSTNVRYPGMGRVKSISLRGQPSSGLIVKADDPSWKEGKDVSDYYGVQKYEPPPSTKTSGGDIDSEHAQFRVYTEIENLRNFPDIFQEGEEVVITEKLHGSNGRIGFVAGQWMAGSHERRRKQPIKKRTGFPALLEKIRLLKPFTLDQSMDEVRANKYWYPYSISEVRAMVSGAVKSLVKFSLPPPSGNTNDNNIIVYGELIGTPYQGKFNYGQKQGELGFRVFDISCNLQYLDWTLFESLCNKYKVQMVPVLYRGPFSMDVVKKYAAGDTTMGATNIREGVVIRPVVERHDPRIGRVVLKYISDAYLEMKHKKADAGEEVETKEV